MDTALVESLVLGKVILLGEIFHLGESVSRLTPDRSHLYRTVSFSVLVLVFAEHFVKGSIHRENIAAIVGNLAAKDGADLAARILVMFIAFIPMFAIWEISNLFGEGKLFELFFESGFTAGTTMPGMTNAASPRQG
jgi:hypothetical protein